MNLEFYEKFFIKLKKINNYVKDERGASINEPFLIYDESEFIQENEEEKIPEIKFSKNNVTLKIMIKNFLMKLTELKLRRLIIVSDEISSISLYEETFIQMGITPYIISSQSFQVFQKYTQNFNLISVNLFSYQNYNIEKLIKESITQYEIGLEEISNFDLGLDFYLTIKKIDNPFQYCRNDHLTIIISGVNIDQCKILKKNTEKLIKIHKLIETYKYDFIRIEKVFESLGEMINFMKSSELLPYSQKILEQIFIGYSIKKKLNKYSGGQYFEGVGKM
jgi:methyl-accepting chemotaxis protein